uniref:Uncharacterized protein n=1 Tax=Anopheles stephensi TaxID=30069 RepID=A0A182YSQ6_ANOST
MAGYFDIHGWFQLANLQHYHLMYVQFKVEFHKLVELLELAIGDDRLIKAVTSSNVRRRDHRHKKKPQSTAVHRRFGGLDDTFDESMNIARFLEPNDDDLNQMLLLNAAAAAMATIPDDDASISNAPFNRKLFNENH